MPLPSGYGPVSTFALSGDPILDAFINFGYKWGAGSVGTAVNVTYSFPQAGASWVGGYGEGEPSGLTGFNASQQAAAEAALDLWAEVANISFTKVNDTAGDVGDIRFGFSSVVSNDPFAIAWGYFPYTSPEAGDMWFDPTYGPNLQMQPGQFGFSTLLHEIGHAIGLDHPFDDGFGEPTLPAHMDNNQYTIMAYDLHPTASVEAMTPMLLDILAIQYMYGANMDTRIGDDVYKFSTSAETLKAIWDAGGIDTIDASDHTLAAKIDLHDGAFSSIGRRNAGGAATDNIAIAYGAIIENARGGSGNDTIIGNEIANELSGNAGNDLLDGGLGDDVLRGGKGNDIYVLDSAADIVDEEANSDTGDEVRATFSIDLNTFAGGKIERAMALGNGNISLIGNSVANMLVGNSGDNILDGSYGNDTMRGGAGNDTYYVDSTGDIIDEQGNTSSGDWVYATFAANLNSIGGGAIENAIIYSHGNIGVTGNAKANRLYGGSGNNTIDGGAGDDLLWAGAGNDILMGGAGNDYLDGVSGNNILRGGSGNDTYVIHGAGDIIDEQGNKDTGDIAASESSMDISKLGAGAIEIARLRGSANASITGNASANRLAGNNGDNVLNGAGGDDILNGRGGIDTLLGGAGKDWLNGAEGDDILRGGSGNDTYIIDSAGDIVDEEGNNDTFDQVRIGFSTDLATFAGGRIEYLVLTGTDAIDGWGNSALNWILGNENANLIDGREGDDVLAGYGGNDTLLGGDGRDWIEGRAGDDILDGGAGIDNLLGGAGNDTYIINDTADKISEGGNKDTGDEIRATISINLADYDSGSVENVTLLAVADLNATGTSANNKLAGNSGANTLSGGAGNDYLDGGLGDDVLLGGSGDDIYVVNSLADVVDEQGNKDTSDEVHTGAFSISLATFAAGAIEHATLLGNDNFDLTGTSANNKLTGNKGDNTIDGGSGDDILDGGDGNDTLVSGMGSDQLYGGSGDDLLVVPTISGQVISGETGFDEVKIVTAGVKIDLTTLNDSLLTGIESIDLTGTGDNALTASALDIKSALDGGPDFFIKGDAGDSVKLTDTAWHAGYEVIDGRNYHVYSYGTSLLHIEEGISVSIDPPVQITLGTVPGFRIAGPSSFSSGHSTRFGTIIGGVGDFNEDGFDDVLISSGRDVAYLLYGQADAFPTKFSADDVVGTDIAELAGAAGSWTGKSFSGLGDFNGDGRFDLAIGASNEDLNGIDSGGVYVAYGTGSGILGHESLTAMAGTDGFVVSGPGAGGRVGSYFAVQGGGDFNGDGYDDLLVATPDASSSADRAAYVIFGASNTPAAFALPTLGSGGGFKFTAASGSQIGGSMASAGDLNGDGYDDVVISTNSKSYVVLGGPQSFPSSIAAESLDGSNGFSLSSGVTVLSSGGDFNGDGYDDLVVADSWAGRAYVVFGKAGGFLANLDLTTLDGSNGFAVEADWIGSTGNGASLTGDYNADGFDDLLIGVPRSGPGLALLIYGHAGAADPLLTLAEVDGFNGLKIMGVSSGDNTGAGVGSTDINGDGFDDILIGSAFGDGDSADSGTLDVIYGADFRNEGVIAGSFSGDTLNGSGAANRIVAGQGDDVINGHGGADVINAGQGNDEIHVADNKFFRIDSGTGVDTLHLDYSGAIDFGNLDGNASTSDRGRIENVEIIDVANGHANAMTLHIADVLDVDVTISDVGGIAALDNVLRIDGESGDTLQLFSADGWGAADASTLAGYAIYSYQAVKVAVDTDIAITVT